MKTRLIILALWLPLAAAQSAPVRVAAWDLQPVAVANGAPSGFDGHLILEAAQTLKKSNPDVILLQHVPGWQACEQLTAALRPETYHVVTCSVWRDPRAQSAGGQVAILSKVNAYISWSEPWLGQGESSSAPGGFSFAAIRLQDTNVGVFSIQLGEGAPNESARQFARQLAMLQKWKSNRLKEFIVAADFASAANDLQLEHLGFKPAAGDAPVFTRNSGPTGNTAITRAAHFERGLAACDVELAAATAAPAAPKPPVVAEVYPAKPAATPRPAIQASAPSMKSIAAHKIAPAAANRFRNLAWIGAALGICAVLVFFVRKMARPPAPPQALPQRWKTGVNLRVRPPATSAPRDPPFVHIEIGGSTQTRSQSWPPRGDFGIPAGRLPDAVRGSVIANLTLWLKQKMVRRLVADRRELMATQEAATLKVLAVDERLKKIEQQIQRRNQEYEQRIDTLLKALVTAEEQNRELIRAQIVQVKAEMEKARRRAEQEKSEHREF